MSHSRVIGVAPLYSMWPVHPAMKHRSSDRHSNDSVKTISAIFPCDRTIRSQIDDRIPFRTARADALPPVAAHSSARHEPQTTKIDLFVYMRVSLQDDADVIV